jgi:hypothetical protein
MKQGSFGVRVGRRLYFFVAAVVIAFGLNGGVARADAGWFESGDVVLRNDLLLLNDAGVIRIPVSHWPLPRAAVTYALQGAKEHFATNAAVKAALDRVRSRVAPPDSTRYGDAFTLEATLSAGSPGLLRDFDTLAREEGNLSARAGFSSDRFSVTLNVTGVTSPADRHEIRPDGSEATVQLGNWLLSANTLDRWWGPSHESSLILSSNARPMPTVMVERAAAIPFETPWLSWFGPWRMSFGISRMEDHREDIDAPLFMAWRVVIMPFHDIELGFSRTAQFCGKQLECNLDVFGNLLAGNDNVGFDSTPENEPGNQMAGFDIRWNSPIGNWPYAIYSQFIGEDESSYVPAKYLMQYGAEIWKPLATGGLVQAFAEYSDTSCGTKDLAKKFDCAYNQGRFNVEGYRYHGRSIGHTADRDAETYAIGATYTADTGELWTVTVRKAQLNRDDSADPRNTVSPGPANYSALELGWRGQLRGQGISVDLGVESLEPANQNRDVEPFGFVGWTYNFQP